MSEEKKERPKVGVGVLVFKDGKILLGKRRWKHGDGEYAFPGGHVEYMQSFEDCARAETLEEAGVKIKNIRFSCVANSNFYPPRHEVYIGMIADWESGEPRSLDDERIVGWDWYDLDNLPSPLFKFCDLSIDSYKTGKFYYDKK
jgi:8-oxo-dGTP diphosphatase